jgi:DNA-binding transcriptional MerR regulator
VVPEHLTIGELAERTGTATSALRYYEDVGLLSPSARVSGHRRYDESAVAVVGVILVLQEVGFTLAEVKTLLAARVDAPDTWRKLTEAKVRELDDRIAKATAAKIALKHSLRCGHEDVVDCPNFQAVVKERLEGTPLTESHVH